MVRTIFRKERHPRHVASSDLALPLPQRICGRHCHGVCERTSPPPTSLSLPASPATLLRRALSSRRVCDAYTRATSHLPPLQRFCGRHCHRVASVTRASTHADLSIPRRTAPLSSKQASPCLADRAVRSCGGHSAIASQTLAAAGLPMLLRMCGCIDIARHAMSCQAMSCHATRHACLSVPRHSLPRHGVPLTMPMPNASQVITRHPTS